MTHFGASDDVDGQLAEVGAAARPGAAFARDHDFPEFDAAGRDEIAASATGDGAAYAQAAPGHAAYEAYAGTGKLEKWKKER